MPRLISMGFLLSLLLGMGLTSHAATIRLVWNASLGATEYRLYYGEAPGSYHTVLPVGATLGASVSGLTAGTRYFFAATAVNAVGESGFSNEVQAVAQEPPPVDTIPPSVAMILPEDGATVRRRSMVVIEAEATDNIGVASVVLTVNSQLLCTELTVPYACSWHVPNPPNRTYELRATARDVAGNTAAATIRVTSR